jgi:hypothetical protein
MTAACAARMAESQGDFDPDFETDLRDLGDISGAASG